MPIYIYIYIYIYIRNFTPLKWNKIAYIYIYIYIYIYAILFYFSGERVIIIGNCLGNAGSNPGLSCLHFTSCSCPWESHDSSSTPLCYG